MKNVGANPEAHGLQVALKNSEKVCTHMVTEGNGHCAGETQSLTPSGNLYDPENVFKFKPFPADSFSHWSIAIGTRYV